MRVVLLTGKGVEHRYVTSRFVESFGDDLAAVVVATGISRPLTKRLKSYARRYSIPQIVSRVRDGEQTKIRAVSRDGKVPGGAQTIADPTLEEAYLAFMAARGRADVALAEEEQ